MQIREIDGFVANCEAKGVFRDVSLFMMQDEALAIDDFIVVHVGYAIQKITPQEAQTAWELYDQMLAADDLPTDWGKTSGVDCPLRTYCFRLTAFYHQN